MAKAKPAAVADPAPPAPEPVDGAAQVVFTTSMAGNGFSFSPGIAYPLASLPFTAAELERMTDGGLAKLV